MAHVVVEWGLRGVIDWRLDNDAAVFFSLRHFKLLFDS